jgi:hypothetical protein
MLRRKLTAAAMILALAGAAGGVPGVALGGAAPATLAAKPCSAGWKHAVIGGSHKCLRRGQFCALRYDRQYHRYGYHCHASSEDSRGNYHLT